MFSFCYIYDHPQTLQTTLEKDIHRGGFSHVLIVLTVGVSALHNYYLCSSGILLHLNVAVWA